MGTASLLFVIGIIVAICAHAKDSSESKRHQQENPWKENMTDEERQAWIIKNSEIVQREGWKKLGL